MAALIAATLLLVDGCNLNPPPLTIAVNSGVEGVALKDAAYRYATDRGITVEIVEYPYDRLYDEELDQLQQEVSAYDVVMMDDPWLTGLLTGEGRRETGDMLLEPIRLDGMDNQARDDFLVDFFDSCREVCTYPRNADGVLYALPFVGNTQLLVYNRDVSPRPPGTWDDVVRIHQTAIGNDQVGYVMRVRTGNSIVTDFLPILWSAGGEAGEGGPATPRQVWRRALSHFRDLSEVGEGPNWSLVAADDFDLGIHLIKGTASMSIIWSAWTMAMTGVLADPGVRSETLLVAEVPGQQPALGAWLLGVPRASGRKALAHDFVRFATGPDVIARSIGFGNPSPRRSHYDGTGGEANAFPWFQCQAAALESARPRPGIPNWRAVERELGTILSRLYARRFGAGSDPVDSAVDQVEAAGLFEVIDPWRDRPASEVDGQVWSGCSGQSPISSN
jgi:multiple sugar transport system substrate-binding protein